MAANDKKTTKQTLERVKAWANQEFVRNTVNNLVNYYLKSETYTKAEVQQLLNAIKQFTYQVVPSLPAASADTMNVIYLVPTEDPKTKNVKDEFITIDNGAGAATRYTWEQIGSTQIDLSGYYTSAQTDAAITAALNSALANYTTTANLNTLLSGKVDKVSGKGLSTNDYTNEEKAKLGALPTEAELNNEFAISGVYDVSAKNPTAGPNNDGKWESLSALLSDANLNALIPTAYRKGGMTLKFVCSSDNKYMQFRLRTTSFSTIESDWLNVGASITQNNQSGHVDIQCGESLHHVASVNDLYETNIHKNVVHEFSSKGIFTAISGLEIHEGDTFYIAIKSASAAYEQCFIWANSNASVSNWLRYNFTVGTYYKFVAGVTSGASGAIPADITQLGIQLVDNISSPLSIEVDFIYIGRCVEEEPASNSKKLITSGGAYQAIVNAVNGVKTYIEENSLPYYKSLTFDEPKKIWLDCSIDLNSSVLIRAENTSTAVWSQLIVSANTDEQSKWLTYNLEKGKTIELIPNKTKSVTGSVINTKVTKLCIRLVTASTYGTVDLSIIRSTKSIEPDNLNAPSSDAVYNLVGNKMLAPMTKTLNFSGTGYQEIDYLFTKPNRVQLKIENSSTAAWSQLIVSVNDRNQTSWLVYNITKGSVIEIAPGVTKSVTNAVIPSSVNKIFVWLVTASTYGTVDVTMIEGTNKIELDNLSPASSDAVYKKVKDAVEATAINDILLPSKFYVAQSQENNIYFENVVKIWNKELVGFGASAGKCLGRRVVLPKASQNITLYEYNLLSDATSAVKNKTTALVLSDNTSNSVVVCTIGDSFTETGIWWQYVHDCNSNIEFVGMRKGMLNSSSSQRCEGRGGWTLAGYLSRIKGDGYYGFTPFMHPTGYVYYGNTRFWKEIASDTKTESYRQDGYDDYKTMFSTTDGRKLNPSENDLMYDDYQSSFIYFNGSSWVTITEESLTFEFDYAKYLSAWNISTPNAVIIMLGTNDFYGTHDSNFISTWNENMAVVINSIHSVDSDIKIILAGGTLVGGYPVDRQGLNLPYQILNKNLWVGYNNLISTYDNNEYVNNNVYVVPACLSLDPDYGLVNSEIKPFDLYSGDLREMAAGNTIHPSEDGYKLIGVPLLAAINKLYE